MVDSRLGRYSNGTSPRGGSRTAIQGNNLLWAYEHLSADVLEENDYEGITIEFLREIEESRNNKLNN